VYETISTQFEKQEVFFQFLLQVLLECGLSFVQWLLKYSLLQFPDNIVVARLPIYLQKELA